MRTNKLTPEDIREYTITRVKDLLWDYIRFIEGETDINPHGLSELSIIHQYRVTNYLDGLLS